MAGMTLGAQIKEIRHYQLRLTQADFADELGVRSIQVSRWERDAAVPSLSRLSQIAALAGLSLAEFFEGLEIKDAA